MLLNHSTNCIWLYSIYSCYNLVVFIKSLNECLLLTPPFFFHCSSISILWVKRFKDEWNKRSSRCHFVQGEAEAGWPSFTRVLWGSMLQKVTGIIFIPARYLFPNKNYASIYQSIRIYFFKLLFYSVLTLFIYEWHMFNWYTVWLDIILFCFDSMYLKSYYEFECIPWTCTPKLICHFPLLRPF